MKYPMEPKIRLEKNGGADPVDAHMYRCLIGCLRPDLSYVVGVVSRFMESPTKMHQQALKHILRYVAGSVDYGLVYTRREEASLLIGYSDSNLAGDIVDRKSTTGTVFYVYGNVVSHMIFSKAEECGAFHL